MNCINAHVTNTGLMWVTWTHSIDVWMTVPRALFCRHCGRHVRLHNVYKRARSHTHNMFCAPLCNAHSKTLGHLHKTMCILDSFDEGEQIRWRETVVDDRINPNIIQHDNVRRYFYKIYFVCVPRQLLKHICTRRLWLYSSGSGVRVVVFYWLQS